MLDSTSSPSSVRRLGGRRCRPCRRAARASRLVACCLTPSRSRRCAGLPSGPSSRTRSSIRPCASSRTARTPRSWSTHRSRRTLRATQRSSRGRFLLRVHRPRRHGRTVDSAAAIRVRARLVGRVASRNRPCRARAAAGARRATRDDRPRPRMSTSRDAVRCCGGWTAAATRHPRDPSTSDGSATRWLGSTTTPTDGRRPMGSSASGGTGRRSSATPWSTAASTRQTSGTSFPRICGECSTTSRRRPGSEWSNSARTPGTFGLIHADLHLDNTLFADGEARLIDFDDCGFGYRIYDVAVALWELRHRRDYTRLSRCSGRGIHRAP